MKTFEHLEKSNFTINIIITLCISLIIGYLLCVLSIKLSIVALIIVIFALFILIINSYTKIFKTEASFLWLIFLFPLLPYHLGYDLGSFLPVMKIHRILTFFMLFIWFTKNKYGYIKECIKTFPLTKIFLFIFISMAVSSMLSSSKFRSFFYLGTFGIEYFLFSVMIFDLLRDREKQERMFFLIAIASTLLAIIGIVEYLTGKNIYFFIKPFRGEMEYVLTHQIRGGSFRIKGSFDHAISFGIFMALSSVSVMHLYQTRRGVLKKIFYIGLFFIMGLTVLLTKSRGAIGCYCILWATFLSLKGKRELIILSVFLMFFLVQPFFLQDLKNEIIIMIKSSFSPFKHGDEEMFSAVRARVDLFNAMIGLVMKNPIFGYGKIDFGHYYIDNFFLSYALSFGFLGFLSYSLLICVILYIAIFLFIKGDRGNKKLLGASMIGVLLGLIFAWATVALTSYFYLLWLYVGILARIYVDEKSKVKSHLNLK